jgi:hypothetical protein
MPHQHLPFPTNELFRFVFKDQFIMDDLIRSAPEGYRVQGSISLCKTQQIVILLSHYSGNLFPHGSSAISLKILCGFSF